MLKEVLAHFTVLVDDKPLTDLDKKIEKVKKRFVKFGRYAALGFGVAIGAAYKFVDAASEVAENTNRLDRVFKRSAGTIREWSTTFGKAAGRSRWRLEQGASTFGAFLGPMMGDITPEKLAEMSTRLQQLTVDLASFYDVSDEEARTRVMSGIQGETEAARRFGVDLSDKGLQKFAKEQMGFTGAWREADMAYKTMVRYQKFFADTVDKQNDAILTIDSFANRMKKAKDTVYDMSVMFGQDLMEGAKGALGAVQGLLDGITSTYKYLAHTTSGLKVLSLFMAGAGAVWLTKWLGGLSLIQKALKTFELHFAKLTRMQAMLKLGKGLAIGTAGALALDDITGGMNRGSNTFTGALFRTAGVQDPAQAIVEGWTMITNDLQFFFEILGAGLKDLTHGVPALLGAAVTPGMSVGDVAKGDNFWKNTKRTWRESPEERRRKEKKAAFDAAALRGDFAEMEKYADFRWSSDKIVEEARKSVQLAAARGTIDPATISPKWFAPYDSKTIDPKTGKPKHWSPALSMNLFDEMMDQKANALGIKRKKGEDAEALQKRIQEKEAAAQYAADQVEASQLDYAVRRGMSLDMWAPGHSPKTETTIHQTNNITVEDGRDAVNQIQKGLEHAAQQTGG